MRSCTRAQLRLFSFDGSATRSAIGERICWVDRSRRVLLFAAASRADELRCQRRGGVDGQTSVGERFVERVERRRSFPARHLRRSASSTSSMAVDIRRGEQSVRRVRAAWPPSTIDGQDLPVDLVDADRLAKLIAVCSIGSRREWITVTCGPLTFEHGVRAGRRGRSRRDRPRRRATRGGLRQRPSWCPSYSTTVVDLVGVALDLVEERAPLRARRTRCRSFGRARCGSRGRTSP